MCRLSRGRVVVLGRVVLRLIEEVRRPVLARSISCDDGVRYDLACDGCGASFTGVVDAMRDPDAMLRAARRSGWVGNAEINRCPDCAAATHAVAGAEHVR